jgi:hypothetical protein
MPETIEALVSEIVVDAKKRNRGRADEMYSALHCIASECAAAHPNLDYIRRVANRGMGKP